MADKQQDGTRTTGNVPVSDISPGGAKGPPSTGGGNTREPVESGDRNGMGKEPSKGASDDGRES